MNAPLHTATRLAKFAPRLVAWLPLAVLLAVAAVVADCIAGDVGVVPALAMVSWLAFELHAHHRLASAQETEAPQPQATAPAALAEHR